MNEILEILPVGSFRCNCIILGDPVTKEAIVIDPGDEVERILKKVVAHGLKLKSIVHTHTHLDHIGGTTALQKATNARMLMHKEDLFLYENMEMQGRYLGMSDSQIMAPVPPDEFLIDGYGISAGTLEGQTFHIPGHTPGSCAFYFPKAGATGLLFPGDTLFAGSIGRTDLWKGDYDQEISSIKKKLLTLDDEVVIIPGHGPKTKIGFEKRNNPFLV